MSIAATVKRWMRTGIRFRAVEEAVAVDGAVEAEGKTQRLSRNRMALLLLPLPRVEADEAGEEGTRVPARALTQDREMRQRTRLA
jgi:hypothetical protein